MDMLTKSIPTMRTLQGRLAYLREVLSPARPLRIADVGANPINTPDYDVLHQMGGAEIWGFEPDEDAFAALMETPQTGAHYVQKAVGKTGKATFYPHPRSGLGSLLKIDADAVSYLGHPGWATNQGQGIALETVALDDLSEKELPKPDVLKIDIQGGELDVFQHGRAKLSEAVAVVTEVRFARIYENEALWADLDIELRSQGFALHKLMFTKAEPVGNSQRAKMRSPRMRNQLMDGDAVYIRDPMTLAGWSSDQVKQMAIAAAGMFDSLDITIWCLDELVRRESLPAEVPATFFAKLPKWLRNPARGEGGT